MTSPPEGSIGKNSSLTPWEDALNIFDCTRDSSSSQKVPSRQTILDVVWLKWDVWASTHGSKDPKGWDYVARSSTLWMQYWGVASANYEAFDPVMKAFYGNMDETLASLKGDPNYNPLGQPWTFGRAFGALNGTKSLLDKQAAELKVWRDKVGKKGDDFQGTGAGAFRDYLDDLAFRCTDLVTQLGTRSAGLNSARTLDKDDPATKEINEAESGLRWAFNKLQEGYDNWMHGTNPGYKTALFGTVNVPNNQLAWPGGALNAIWNSSGLKPDLESHKSTASEWSGGEHYPKSALMGADARSPAFWNGIMTAARDLWTDHIEATLDVAATAVLTQLPKSYDAARALLPTIREPRRLNLHKAPPPPPPGSQGPPPPPPPPPGPQKGGPKPPPGSGKPPPKIPDSKDTKDTKDKKGSGGGPPPPPPPPGPPKNGSKPPPAPPKPDDRLKVPTGSTIGPDGVVLGPDKKPLLDPLGRQIIVPPGSRIGPDGNIIGPKGDKLAEKDRLARPEPVKKDESRQTELDRYLKSLRGDSTPSMPTLLAGSHAPSVSLSSGGSSNLHNGLSSGKPAVGSIGAPAPAGSVSGHEPPAPPGKPVTTEGGPSLIKERQGNGTQQNGMGGVPFYPPTAGGQGVGAGGDQNKGERDRTTWLTEDEETWGTDPKLPPSVLGARRRGGRVAGRGAGGPRNYGQGGNDGRLAGGTTSPGHGHAEGSA
ncbi:collagen adhesion protein [Amycolatopsis orientalis]|uniref:Collagen adhesion protein n=1 Tax=Amycolatopsis orientalis TaxID=31958 RepID=A0A193BV91_AMYOR|nr:hypothetical protein [Amycolatopsis orientalis]ANN16146.1 collagen adhesion protein [Amycolatopsis orientalis]